MGLWDFLRGRGTGRDCSVLQPSLRALRDSAGMVPQPNVETLGYCRMSLRDKQTLGHCRMCVRDKVSQ